MGKLTKQMIEKIRRRYEELGSYSEVAKELGLDPRTVKKHVLEGSEEPEVDPSSKAFRLFGEGKTPLEVAITLGLNADEVEEMYEGYWRLKGLYELYDLYSKLQDEVWAYLALYNRMKGEGMNPDEFVLALKDIQELRKVRSEVEDAKSEYVKVLSEMEDAKREKEKMLVELRFSKDFVEAWFGKGLDGGEAINRVVNALLARKVSPEAINEVLSAISLAT
jgi:predicted transcriptional regulator